LVGFLRKSHCNIYSHPQRLVASAAAGATDCSSDGVQF